MGRRSTPTIDEITASLKAVQLMVRGSGGAMPTLAAEMRREACERIDDVIDDLGALQARKRG